MKNIIKKTFFIIAIILIVLTVFMNYSYCDIVSDMDYRNENIETNKITKGINIIFNLIRYAGTGISVIMLLVLAIKYMITSVEEKAEIKKQAIPIVVGSAFLFAGSNLIGIVGGLIDGL